MCKVKSYSQHPSLLRALTGIINEVFVANGR